MAAREEVWKLIPTNGISIHLFATEPDIVVPWLRVKINNNKPIGKSIIEIPLNNLYGICLIDIINNNPKIRTIKCLIK